MAKEKKNDKILEFVRFWKQQNGQAPQELVFDAKLTTQANLRKLEELGIRFVTLRRRNRKMLAEIYARSASAWQRITLPTLTRSFRNPKVFEENIILKGYQAPQLPEKSLRQLSITEFGHEAPTILITNHFKAKSPELITNILDLSGQVDIDTR